MKVRSLLFYVSLLAAHGSIFISCVCGTGAFVADTDPSGWIHDTVEVRYPNEDTLGFYTVDLIVGHTGAYIAPFDLFVTTMAPDSAFITERVKISPRWDGTPRMAEYRRGYRRDVKFSQAGDYVFGFSTAADIAGVTSVGVVITKQQNGKR